MVAGPMSRTFTFLSAAPAEDKHAVLINLAAAVARAGSDVLLLDACSEARGIVARFGMPLRASLLEAARGERAPEEMAHELAQGFAIAALHRGPLPAPGADAARLADAFGKLARACDVLIADAELDADGVLPVETMADGEIVVLVTNNAESIKAAYTLIKRLNARIGRRPFGILVSGASEKEAQLVFANMARAASRYLALELQAIGSVPADEHLRRAERLERPVVDAFPLAPASVAFRRLAGRFATHAAVPDMRAARPARAGAMGA
jgi:flagellar biosynthesis protein FlhG